MAWNFTGALYGSDYRLLTEALLPFALIFTIVYAVLTKTKILGTTKSDEPRKNFNVIISLVMALAVVLPHLTNSYPDPSWDVVTIINSALPNVALVAVIIVMLLIVLGVAGKPIDFSKSDYMGGGFTLISILVVLFIFLSSADVFDTSWTPIWLYFIYDPSFQMLIVALIVFGLIIKFITKDDDAEKKTSQTNVFKELNKIMKD